MIYLNMFSDKLSEGFSTLFDNPLISQAKKINKNPTINDTVIVNSDKMGSLNCKKVLLVCPPHKEAVEKKGEEIINKCYSQIFKTAFDDKNITSLSMPIFNTGKGGIDKGLNGKHIFEAVETLIKEGKDDHEIVFVVHESDQESFDILSTQFYSYCQSKMEKASHGLPPVGGMKKDTKIFSASILQGAVYTKLTVRFGNIEDQKTDAIVCPIPPSYDVDHSGPITKSILNAAVTQKKLEVKKEVIQKPEMKQELLNKTEVKKEEFIEVKDIKELNPKIEKLIVEEKTKTEPKKETHFKVEKPKQEVKKEIKIDANGVKILHNYGWNPTIGNGPNQFFQL